MVGTERFRVSFRPNFHAAITDHRQLQPLATEPTQLAAEIVRRSLCPIKKTSTPTSSFFGLATDAVDVLARLSLSAALYLPRFQNLWRLSQSFDNRTRKLIRSNFLFADFFVVDVVGVNAVFNRAQPCVVDLFGVFVQSDVDQHHHRAEQKTGRIREILSGAPWGGAVNRFEHRHVLADVCRPREAD